MELYGSWFLSTCQKTILSAIGLLLYFQFVLPFHPVGRRRNPCLWVLRVCRLRLYSRFADDSPVGFFKKGSDIGSVYRSDNQNDGNSPFQGGVLFLSFAHSEPKAGLEPATYSLRMSYSTNWVISAAFACKKCCKYRIKFWNLVEMDRFFTILPTWTACGRCHPSSRGW